jgi:hypothetical protein
LYGCGKTGQNTDLLKIEHPKFGPKNSFFQPDKWASAPPGDGYTRGQVRSGTACCKHAWHFQVYTSSHGTHLHVNHGFWFAPNSHTVYILALEISWEHMQGLPETETMLTIACDTHATQRSMSGNGII